MKCKATLKVLVLLILLTGYAGFAQAKKVTEADYKKWHTLSGVSISPDGLWSSFKVQYEYSADTLFIEQIKTKRRLSFARASHAEFTSDGKSAIISYPDNSLLIHNLSGKHQIKIDNVEKYGIENSQRCIAVLANAGASRKLAVYNTSGKPVSSIDDVADFKFSASGKMAVITQTGVTICDPLYCGLKTNIISGSTAIFKNPVWNKSGNVLAFIQARRDISNSNSLLSILVYKIGSKKLLTLDNNRLGENQITDYIQTPLTLSDDGTKLFFYYNTAKLPTAKNDLVEIWDSGTKLVYPAQQVHDDLAAKPKLAVWDLDKDTIRLLATDEFPSAFLTPDRTHALTYSYLSNEPQYEMIAPVDLNIVNIQSGETGLLLKKQPVSGFAIGCSPSGRYINYFKDRHWWLYDTEARRHTNLTDNIDARFDDINFDQPGASEGFDSPGWTSDSEYIILYDNYDIWLVSPNSGRIRKITDGVKDKVKFRIVEYIYQQSDVLNSGDFAGNKFDLSKGLILSATGSDQSTGYYKWHPNGTLQKIEYGAFKLSSLRRSQDDKQIVYVKETYENPPTVYNWSETKKEAKKLFQSNPHAKKYQWGKSRLITYKNEAGQQLQGALFYPAGFEQSKRYPMIVYIYSRLSSLVYDYNNPTMYNVAGFAHANYTSDGYLVLFPDIHYKVGDPGKSILECVTAGVNAVKAMGIADEKRIGIIGHSYGGYETCHLLTRTPIFAAAVAGAAVTDMVSSYLSLNTSNGVKMDWRYESQQYRMGCTPFNNLKGYLENSTVTNAASITTPLLNWAGKEDRSVDWKQSVELHLALRRLGKRNVFLTYPNEGHILSEPAAQYDLTVRIRNWFDHYLKGKQFPDGGAIP